MRVEEGEFLLAVHGIVGVVDVEHDVPGWSREAPAIEIDLTDPDTGQRTPVGKVLEPRQGRLAHQVGAALRASAARRSSTPGSVRNASTSSQSS